MNRLLLSVVVLSLAVSFSAGQTGKASKEDVAAIKQTALDYIEGWCDGNAERMQRALHPALVKRGLMPFRQTGKMLINPINAEMMIELTRAGVGKLPEDQRNISVEVLDVYKDIAMVKCASAKFIDYMHMAKQEGQWRIVNVLWMLNEAPPPPPK